MAQANPALRPSALSIEAVITDLASDARVHVAAVDVGMMKDVRIAVAGYQPSLGDRVLLTQTSNSTFVIGVIASSLVPPIPSNIGVAVAVEEGCVVLRGTDGELVLRHDPEAKVTRLGAAAGDLLLEAPDGKVSLRAKELEFEADTITTRARRVMTIASHLGWSADRWDLRVHRIKERAQDVLRTVDGALTTRAGRLRTVVKTSAQLLAKRTTIRSKEDTAIDGRQVLLG